MHYLWFLLLLPAFASAQLLRPSSPGVVPGDTIVYGIEGSWRDAGGNVNAAPNLYDRDLETITPVRFAGASWQFISVDLKSGVNAIEVYGVNQNRVGAVRLVVYRDGAVVLDVPDILPTWASGARYELPDLATVPKATLSTAAAGGTFFVTEIIGIKYAE